MRKTRLQPTANSGAMADIAFLLLVFFMVVTTFDKDYSLTMNLPPYSEERRSGPVDKDRLIKISINGLNDIMIGPNPYVENPTEEIALLLKDVIALNKEPIILIQMHPASDYQQYISVVSYITHAKNILKDEMAQALFHISYTDLEVAQQKKIESKIKIRISEKEMELI